MRLVVKTCIILLIIPMILSSCLNHHSEDVALSWIPEESNFVDYEINGGQSQKQKMLSQWNINTIGLCGENGNIDNEDNEMYLQQYIRNVFNKKPMYIPNPKKNFTMPANTFENILEQQEANLFTPK